jgi:hypothetical protein
MQLIVGQQLHAAREVLLQHLDREVVSRALVGGDVVERLLVRDPVQRRRPIRVEPIQHIAHSLLAWRRLQIAVVFHRPHHRHRGAGRVGAYDQADPIRQRRIRHRNKHRWHLELSQRLGRPLRQLHGLGRSRRDLLAAAESLFRDRLTVGYRLQRRRDGVGVQQVLLRDAIHVGQRHFPDGVNVLIRRVAALGGERVRPHLGQIGNRVPLELRLSNLSASGRVHQVLGQAVGRVLVNDLPQLLEHWARILPGGKRHHAVAHAGFGIRLRQAEFRAQRFARGHQAVDIAALARQHVHQNL